LKIDEIILSAASIWALRVCESALNWFAVSSKMILEWSNLLEVLVKVPQETKENRRRFQLNNGVRDM
jgi:hypothetical protein